MIRNCQIFPSFNISLRISVTKFSDCRLSYELKLILNEFLTRALSRNIYFTRQTILWGIHGFENYFYFVIALLRLPFMCWVSFYFKQMLQVNSCWISCGWPRNTIKQKWVTIKGLVQIIITPLDYLIHSNISWNHLERDTPNRINKANFIYTWENLFICNT